ncbi:carboxypeptidase-like regulatory domain-containing protein [Frankia sp. AiPs1]|uniref:MSCRAMM family protein n=1 Tax=Frankia sp. AiPs1 TaxID=573493 RepID=UPI0020447CD1|nr:carboxypeptidase-like regulatory domain-containing protein [Frankia sp. AiPs1]MCM3923117.1 carboxypeptidase-like regulatory domain-containing protein [Frankia sp. AiPs1]
MTASALAVETVLEQRETAMARGRASEQALYLPVPDALAVFLDERGVVVGSTVTSDNGDFEAGGLPPGGYTLMVIHREYQQWRRQVCVGDGESLVADAILTRRLLSCAGTARDARGCPVPAVVVRRTDGSGLELRTRTDASGAFAFRAVPWGAYLLGVVGQAAGLRLLVDKNLRDVRIPLSGV